MRSLLASNGRRGGITSSRDEITADEARLAALRAQGFVRGALADSVPGMLSQVGAVQLDTISVLARSHELIAYARLGAVGRTAVEKAYWGEPAQAFEYYAHGNCILPIEAWPYFAFRRRMPRRRWPEQASGQVLKEVRARLRDGPVTATDLGGAKTGDGTWWSWSDAKRAVEALYYRGEVVCLSRRGWKRVYDLPERALPPQVLGVEPSDDECYSFLVRAAGRALGVATKRDIAEYFRLTRTWASPPGSTLLLETALAESGLVPVRVEGWRDGAFLDATAPEPAAAEHRTVLISPFDSLVWERSRTERLFRFTLSLEAYKPKAQRDHGYFAMPLLADGRLVGRVDPARDGRTLVARKVSLEDASQVSAMGAALREAASWVGCDAVRVEDVKPRGIKKALRDAMR